MSLQLALNSSIGVFEIDAQARLIQVNSAWCQLAAIQLEAIEGNNFFLLIHSDDRPEVLNQWQQMMQSHQPFCTRFRLLRNANEPLWVIGQFIPQCQANGDFVSTRGTLVEIPSILSTSVSAITLKSLSQPIDWERQVLEAVHKIRRTLNLRQILNTTTTEAYRLIQVDRALIFRFEPTWSGTVLTEMVSPEWKPILNCMITDPCFARTDVDFYQGGYPRATTDIHENNYLTQCYIELLDKFQVKAVLSAPILQEGQLWGLLILHQCSHPREWQTWEIDAVYHLAQHVGVAVYQHEQLQQLQRANADLERQVQRSNAQLKLALEFEATLKRIADRVRDSLDENQILETAVRELAISAGVSNCNASLYDLDTRTSTVCYEHTTSLEPVQGRIVMMDNFPEGYTQLLRGQYFQFCSLLPNPKRGRVAMLACPIVDDQGVLGDLWLISQEYRAFNEQDIRLVEQVANQCAIAIRQARLYQASQAQVKELEKLNCLKDDFLSTVSHELRTPISNIKMATQMLELSLQRQGLFSNPESNPISRYFRILNDECHRETRLINDLLDLSRLEVAEDILNLSSVDLIEWLPHLIAPFVERARDHQQTLELSLQPDLPLLTTDVSRLERILNELLNNACKYTPANEVIRLAAEANTTQIYLSISNSGVEISPQELERIFDKFYRIPSKDPWKHGGTGLGLALVKRLAETLGGDVQAQSGRDRTSFVVEIPLVAPEPHVKPSATNS